MQTYLCQNILTSLHFAIWCSDASSPLSFTVVCKIEYHIILVDYKNWFPDLNPFFQDSQKTDVAR